MKCLKCNREIDERSRRCECCGLGIKKGKRVIIVAFSCIAVCAIVSIAFFFLCGEEKSDVDLENTIMVDSVPIDDEEQTYFTREVAGDDHAHLEYWRCSFYSKHVDCSYPDKQTKPMISGYVKYEINYELQCVDFKKVDDSSSFDEYKAVRAERVPSKFVFNISIPDASSSCVGVRDTVIKYALGSQFLGLSESEFENSLMDGIPEKVLQINKEKDWCDDYYEYNTLSFYENQDGRGVLFLFNQEGVLVDVTGRYYIYELSSKGCVPLTELDLIKPNCVSKVHSIADNLNDSFLHKIGWDHYVGMYKIDNYKDWEAEVGYFHVCDSGFVYNYPGESPGGENMIVSKKLLMPYLRKNTIVYDFFYGRQYGGRHLNCVKLQQ